MKLVNKDRANKLVDKGALLIDMRSPIDFRDGHIQNSVNLPLKNFTNKLIGLKRNQKIVLISKSVADPDVKTACGYADQLGFGDVFVTEYNQLLEPVE